MPCSPPQPAAHPLTGVDEGCVGEVALTDGGSCRVAADGARPVQRRADVELVPVLAAAHDVVARRSLQSAQIKVNTIVVLDDAAVVRCLF